MSSVEIRDAVIDDLPELRAVFRRASWANEGDRSLLELHPEFLVLSGVAVGEGRSRVASVDGRAVGFSSILADGDSVELEDLFVDPDWMRRGVGRALVTDVVDLARTAGLLRVVVDANEHALVFYAARRIPALWDGETRPRYGDTDDSSGWSAAARVMITRSVVSVAGPQPGASCQRLIMRCPR